MASEKQLEKIKNEVTCSICLSFYDDPVTLDCGHNFCRACILQYWEPEQGNVTCPECRSEFTQKSVRPNWVLSNIVESVRKLSPAQKQAETDLHCEEHDEKLKLFCSDDQRAICVVCSMSREHKDHAVSPIKEAAELFKEELLKALDFLQKQIQDISKSQSEEEGHLIELKNQGDKLRQKILSEFGKLHQFLNEEEQALQKKVEEKERVLMQQIEANIKAISEQSDSINQIITDIQKRLRLQEMEFLQDIKLIIDRSRVEFKKPKPSCSVLRLVEFKIPLDYTAWKRMLKMINPVLAPAALILDAKTANPWLFLSDSCRTVTVADRKHQVPDNPERFSNWRCVLGSVGFTSGTHYWEVYVGDNTGWGVGVARESVPRKELYALSPKDGVWAVELWSDRYKAQTSCTTSLYLNVRPQKLGVYLDYEGGQVSICDADDLSDVFTFTDTFTEKIYPFFSIYCTGESLKLLPLQQ
ncbi:E3 ubiquitin-protein ligase TRIM39-like [Heterodontus francisci]|uniref:E3 ubiquitin-protein ligase TRIM39-like n=1 Tax=Heterodontus francisci TaxID=7792 RepID=UPI00355AEE6F